MLRPLHDAETVAGVSRREAKSSDRGRKGELWLQVVSNEGGGENQSLVSYFC